MPTSLDPVHNVSLVIRRRSACLHMKCSALSSGLLLQVLELQRRVQGTPFASHLQVCFPLSTAASMLLVALASASPQHITERPFGTGHPWRCVEGAVTIL